MARKQKRRKQKMSISAAVIRFLIGLLLIAIVVFAGFYLLFEVDYSSRLLNSDGTYASTRAYVLPPDGSGATATPLSDSTPEPTPEATAEPPAETPEPTVEPTTDAATTAPSEPTEAPTATAESTQPAIIISTLEPSPSPTPTVAPTTVPTPTAIPTTEPVGARIPDSAISAYRENLKLPKTYSGEGLNVGLSRCYLSKLNYYQVMQVNGWGYIDEAEFDGGQCTTFALITSKDTGKSRVYLCTSIDGASGRVHQPQSATDVNACDFQVTIDTSDFDSGDYDFKLILYYKVGSHMRTWICPFETDHTFTVVDGEIVTGLPLDN
ncbi:MAG: hypothetical protein Q4E13_04730 [Clostridia bacterium]|nr:hypothetical protein [Clostridia bacterium]